MLMTAAAVHMDSSSAHGHGLSSPSSSTSPAPPWLPVVLADDDNHRHQLLRDFTASSSAPSTTTPATAAATNRHHQLRATATATRRVSNKRRPRPSRKLLPTTYITADPASFRRMVHQVTGADDLLPPMAPPAPPEGLCRPAPYRAGAAGALVLPTLDTSAFLLGAPGSAAAAAVDRAEAGGAAGGDCSNSSSSCGGFQTLDSWDAHHLF